jgi:hypothetical protein
MVTGDKTINLVTLLVTLDALEQEYQEKRFRSKSQTVTEFSQSVRLLSTSPLADSSARPLSASIWCTIPMKYPGR